MPSFLSTLKPLKTKKGRDELGLFIVEGESFVLEIPPEYEICQYVFSKKFVENHSLSPFKNRGPIEIVKDSIFEKLSDTVSPQGIMAVCKKINWNINDMIKPNGFILLGENLNDPGNIGALIRTAAAAGASGVILTQGSGDIFNPKVLRAAAGAALRIPIVTNANTNETCEILKQANFAIYAAHLNGTVLPYSLDLTGSFCMMIGNESHGLTQTAASHANKLVYLPMKNDTESLNASVAGSILMYEAVRQRV